MPNDKRSGLKISGNRSDGGMNPPQNPDLNIIQAVWDHLERGPNKRQPTSKEELWDVLQEAWRTIPDLSRVFPATWPMTAGMGSRKMLITDIDFQAC